MRISQLVVSDIVVDVVRKKIKNLYLTIYPPIGRVQIVAPLKTDDDAVRRFVVSKLLWIEKRKKKFLTQEWQPVYKYVSGEHHYYQGQSYPLQIIHSQSKSKVVLHSEEIHLYVPKSTNLAGRKYVMDEWYRQQLKETVPALMDKWQKIIGVEAAEWQIKKMKTRWGTCNVEARRIWLGLELAKKSQNCLEYIIAHELVHLLERSHNWRFKAFMDKFMPQWRSYKKELDKGVAPLPL